MPTITIDVTHNEAARLAAELPSIINRAVRKQVLVTEGDVKGNIVKHDAIDTGHMLASVRGEMTGQTEGQVTVSAESKEGYPYPVAVNYGTVKMAPRPFFTEAETKAVDEFAPRVRAEIEAAL